MRRARRIAKWCLTLLSLALLFAGLANLRYMAFGVFGPFGFNFQCSAGAMAVMYGTAQPPPTASGGFRFWCSDPFSQPTDFVRHWRVNAVWPRILGAAPPRCLMIPLWIPLVLTLGALVVIRLTERRAAPRGHCPKCGYNLTANVSGQCPECGAPCGPAPFSEEHA